jgi:D-alanine-D-alanine ligase
MDQIGVCYGGPSPEHDISLQTGQQICRVLHDAGRDVVGLYWTKTGEWYQVAPLLEASSFAQGPPAGAPRLHLQAELAGGFADDSRKHRPVPLDCVVNCCHGGPGENGTLQAAFDLAGIRYTGPSSAGAALGMDKLATAAVARAAGIAVNEQLATLDAQVGDPATGPFIVKPRRGGSSIGIEVVADVETARRLVDTAVHFADGAVVEPYLEGWTDLNISVRTHPALELTPIEKPLRSSDRVYSYKDKYLSQAGHGLEHAPRELPAQVPARVSEVIEAAARRLAAPLMLRGISRLDFLWDGADRVLFNEVNTIPGAMSLYLWRAAGHTAADVCADLVAESRANPAVRWNTGGADGTALRAAGSIAAKLT